MTRYHSFKRWRCNHPYWTDIEVYEDTGWQQVASTQICIKSQVVKSKCLGCGLVTFVTKDITKYDPNSTN
jgi:hypothetical protein